MSELVRVPPIGEARDRELLKHAVTYAYRETTTTPLHAHFFFPADFHQDDQRPLAIFFHGGFWDTPMHTQFAPHCNHLAARGVIAVAAETRLASTHHTGPVEAIDDARALLTWTTMNSAALGIDPLKTIVGGTAGGALLALSTAMFPDRTNPPACHPPAAMVLFSPLVDTTPPNHCATRFPDPKSAKAHSPNKLIRKGLPPSIIFHGKADRVIPFHPVCKFARKMKRKRNQCEFVDFEKADHAFFNFNVSEQNFELTMRAADRFLVDLGILEAREDDGLS